MTSKQSQHPLPYTKMALKTSSENVLKWTQEHEYMSYTILWISPTVSERDIGYYLDLQFCLPHMSLPIFKKATGVVPHLYVPLSDRLDERERM